MSTRPSLPVGATLAGFRFSSEFAGTCYYTDTWWCHTKPNFTLYLENHADGARLAHINSHDFGLENDEIWRKVPLNVVPAPSVSSVNLVIENSQPNGNYGNDVGIDNVIISPLVCEVPVIRATKHAVLDNTVVGQPTVTDPGDHVIYTYTYKNTSKSTAYNVVVDETLFSGAGVKPVAVHVSGGGDYDGNGLATDVRPNDTIVFRAIYVIDVADILAGGVTNQATVTGSDRLGNDFDDLTDSEDPADDTGGDDDPNFTPMKISPSVALQKRGVLNHRGDGLARIGDTISYRFSVINTGNVALRNVVVTDPGVKMSGGPIASLAPGATDSGTFTATYTLTASDLQHSSFSNSATVRADVQSGGTVADISDDPDDNTDLDVEGDGEPDDPTVVLLPPVISAVDDDFSAAPIDRLMGGQTASVLGNDTIYGKPVVASALVLTPGTAPVTALGSITMDPLTGVITVAPGTAAGTYRYPYQICDIAFPTSCATAVATVLLPASEIMLQKSAVLDRGSDDIANVGDVITYTYSITNAGNWTLYDLTLTEASFSGSGAIPTPNYSSGGSDENGTGGIDLIKGATAVFTAYYALTQQDVNAGFVQNQAIATGVDGSGNAISGLSDDPLNPDNIDSDGDGHPDDPTLVVLPADMRVSLEKTAVLQANANDPSAVGDMITYGFVITNSGNRTLSHLTIDDAQVQVSGGPLASLAPGQVDQSTFTASYRVTQADIDQGRVSNSASVKGQDPGGTDVSDVSDDPNDPTNIDPDGDGNPDDPTVIKLTTSARFILQKTDHLRLLDNRTAAVGDEITYRFTLTNTGNQTLRNVTISDPKIQVQGGPIAQFAPNASDHATFSGTYRLTQADLDSGRVMNTARATAFDPAGNVISILSDDPDDPADIDTDGDGYPDDPTVTILPDVALALTASKSVSNPNPHMGEIVTYSLVFENHTSRFAPDISIIDELPPHLQYVPNSAKIEGTDQEPGQMGRRLVWQMVTIPAGGKVTITFDARLTLLELGQAAINRAWSEDMSGKRISNVAEAEIHRRGEHVFDCSDVIGKVFDDQNVNGYQDEGEPGMPAVRVVTLQGQLITTDAHGRFNLPCAAMPIKSGENISLKLDTRSLPTGYRLTTENPRVVRGTAGKMMRANFGVAKGQISEVDLTASAFMPGSVQMSAALDGGLGQLVDRLRTRPGIVRLSYFHHDEGRQLIEDRLDTVEQRLRQLWQEHVRDPLIIERRSAQIP